MSTKPIAYTLEKNVCRTERFRSMCESTTLSLSMRIAENASAQYTLVSIDEQGKTKIIYEKDLTAAPDGMIRYEHEFDPISLAVYQGSVAFFATVTTKEELPREACITLTENEQIAVELQAARARRSRPKQKKGPLRHVLFVGNSIVFGIEGRYGMCASSPDCDYFHHVSKAISEQYPSCRFSKLYASPIEHAESPEEFHQVFYEQPNEFTGAPDCESFTPDLDLIILQMTDNVNTEKKLETFSVTADLLLSYIKEKCPNATVVWAYGWFHKPAFFPRLLELCERHDIEQADLRVCRSKENEAAKGHLYLAADGTEKVARDTWITHPGDGGMKAIADRILQVLRETSVL